MSLWSVFLGLAAFIAAAGLAMTIVNLVAYRRPPRSDPSARWPLVSMCIPARNEAANLEACVRGLLDQRGVEVEILVYDDQSTDGTGEILARLASQSTRVRRVPTQSLPDGWNGKQHACQRMGEAANGAWLLFTDADVRFEPDAVAGALRAAEAGRADLVSTFPRQITGSFLERLVVPMIHFILLSYLPLHFMRASTSPNASAGCGQFLLVRREAWQRAGGHAAFRDSMHDGIRLPRRVREMGGRTDLFDGTELISCRMYRDFGSCWRGFAKNAYEGLGSFGVLVFFTIIHVVAHLMPWAWLAMAFTQSRWPPLETSLAVGAIAMALLQRLLLAVRFEQSWLGVALHPLAILTMTAIQWHSFALAKRGRREWRGRVQGALPRSAGSGMLSGHG